MELMEDEKLLLLKNSMRSWSCCGAARCDRFLSNFETLWWMKNRQIPVYFLGMFVVYLIQLFSRRSGLSKNGCNYPWELYFWFASGHSN
jgi:hypothetical protein